MALNLGKFGDGEASVYITGKTNRKCGYCFTIAYHPTQHDPNIIAGYHLYQEWEHACISYVSGLTWHSKLYMGGLTDSVLFPNYSHLINCLPESPSCLQPSSYMQMLSIFYPHHTNTLLPLGPKLITFLIHLSSKECNQEHKKQIFHK